MKPSKTGMAIFLAICAAATIFAAQKSNIKIYRDGKILGIPYLVFICLFLVVIGIGYAIGGGMKKPQPENQ